MSPQSVGLRLAAGQPKVIVSIMAPDEAAALARARRIVEADADVCEWRVDQLRDLDDVELILPKLRQTLDGLPLLATIRTADEGGAMRLSAADYADTIAALSGSGMVDAVDVEIMHPGAQAAVTAAQADGVQVVASRHLLAKCPSQTEIADLLRDLANYPVDVCKLAVTAQSPGDVASLLSACAEVSQQVRQPVIAIAMGELGKVSRAAGHIFGSAATFASLDREASAPGQLDIAEVRRAIELLA